MRESVGRGRADQSGAHDRHKRCPGRGVHSKWALDFC
jgi:hypothetical protein